MHHTAKNADPLIAVCSLHRFAKENKVQPYDKPLTRFTDCTYLLIIKPMQCYAKF